MLLRNALWRSSMLIDQIDESMQLGKKYLNAKNAKSYLDDLSYQEGIILSEVDKYTYITKSRDALSKVCSLDRAGVLRIKHGFENIVDDLENMNATSLKKDVEELSDETVREKNALRIVWVNYRNERMKANDALIKALQDVISDEVGLNELSSLRNKVMQVEIGDDSTLQCVNMFSQKSKEIIKALEMSKKVENFLISISEGEDISLDMVTPEIIEWLKKHDLLKKIKVSI